LGIDYNQLAFNLNIEKKVGTKYLTLIKRQPFTHIQSLHHLGRQTHALLCAGVVESVGALGQEVGGDLFHYGDGLGWKNVVE
jgi:hypothetical protein